jgi:AcrR family transcriptional regulator
MTSLRLPGLQRSVIAHYVGNRDALVVAVTDEVISRYITAIRLAIVATPTVDSILRQLFCADWIVERAADDRALDELFREAARNVDTRRRLRAAYELLIGELTEAILRKRTGARRKRAHEAAYQIVALAEANATLQQIGFPSSRSRAARTTSERLVAVVVSPPV